jgi:hypothetical protein
MERATLGKAEVKSSVPATLTAEKVSPKEMPAEAGLAPGVNPKPGALSDPSVRSAGTGTGLQSFSSHPDLTAARMEQKAAGGMEKTDIKKSPWGNDKAGRETVDVLKDILKELKRKE